MSAAGRRRRRMQRRHGASVTATLCALAAAFAFPLLATSETVAIVGGNVHTVTARGMLAGATVLISDGRITAVGTDVEVPPDATRIDAHGKIVTPGIFDTLSYIGIVEISLVDE